LAIKSGSEKGSRDASVRCRCHCHCLCRRLRRLQQRRLLVRKSMMLPSVCDYVFPWTFELPFALVFSASFYYDFYFYFFFDFFSSLMMVINLGLRLWYSKMNIYAAHTHTGTTVRRTHRYIQIREIHTNTAAHVTHTQKKGELRERVILFSCSC